MARRICASIVALLLILATVANSGPVAAQPFELTSKAAILVDATSGDVLFEKNAHEGLPPASVTKLMTLLLVFEALEQGAIHMDDSVRGSAYSASLGGSQIWLEPAEVLPLEELVRAVAIRSANDASAALAEHVAGTHEQFVALMNQRAAQLGMTDTHFTNVHGLYDPDHYMSAYDIAVLSREITLHHPEILDYTGRWEDRIRVGSRAEQWLVNTNRLITRYDGVDGLKTGWTGPESGYCISATAKHGDTRFIAVVMGAPDSETRFDEAAKLLSFGFANFESVRVAASGDVVGRVRVNEGASTEVDAVVADTFGVTVAKGKASKLEKVVTLDENLQAPLVRGDKVGEIIIKLDGEVVGRSDIVAGADVRRASVWRLMFRSLRQTWPFPAP